jgi:rubrerythrin
MNTKKISKKIQSFKTKLNESHGVEGLNDIQLLRKGMIEEIKAINLYEQAAQQAKNPMIRELFLDIAEEEKVHMVEFEELMERFDPSWEEAEEEGEEESEEMFGPEPEND